MTLLAESQRLEETSSELAAGGALLLFAGLALTPLCVTLARRCAAPVPVFFARWRFLHAFAIGVLLLLSMRLAPTLLAPAFGPGDVPEVLRQLAAGALALAATSAAVVTIASRVDPDGSASLGLERRGSLRAALVGIGCYALLVPGILGASFLWPWLFEQLGGDYQPQELAAAIGALEAADRWTAALLAVVVVPCLEELIFRGFLQPLFVQNLGDRGGVALTSLLFAVLHGDSALLPIFCLSLLLGSLKLCTQRLSACAAVHALHNALVFALLDA